MNPQSSIQIYGRIRPLQKNPKIQNTSGRYWINEEIDGTPHVGFHVPKDELQGLINHKKENYEFKFNKIFDVDSEQEEVFDIVAKPVVESSLQGYNGTIFAYGQTGSAFTITGGAEKYADRGLIPRTLQHIFKRIQQDQRTSYTVHVSYLEIYNEIGYDLLDASRDAKKLEDLPKVTLMEDGDELTHLKNLSMVPAICEEDALNYLFVGDTNRMIAETPSNPASSRSHCIFIITLTARMDGEDIIRRSKLHLVDLAGSERVAKTKINGSLLKEAQHINLSLHYLEQVIMALHEQSNGKRTHVPYRNSMMTAVLRDSLGGNCMTTMIATLSVEDESISTCRFAQRVALISNHATMNEEIDPKLMIQRLKQEITRLKAELAIARGENEGFPDGLPDYEKDKIKTAVSNYVKDTSPDSELIFSDFIKIQHAFSLLKDWVIGNDATPGVDGSKGGKHDYITTGMSAEQGTTFEKMKKLVEHRDNEINILVSMIAQLKDTIANNSVINHDSRNSFEKLKNTKLPQISSEKLNSLTPMPNLAKRHAIIDQQTEPISDLKVTKAKLSTEKSHGFLLFKQSYPASEWIDAQKVTLKVKYTEAKKLGEAAQGYRNQMKHIKEQLSNPNSDGERLRSCLPELIQQYKTSYQKLKDLKVEIEHLQHLLEQGRLRMTRDFEAWFTEVYQSESAEEDRFDQPIPMISSRIPENIVGSPTTPTIGKLIEPGGKYESKSAWESRNYSDLYSNSRIKSAEISTEPPNFAVASSDCIKDKDLILSDLEKNTNTSSRSSTRLLSTDHSNWLPSRDNTGKMDLKPRPMSELDPGMRPKSALTTKNSAREDIKAFYKARQAILERNI